MQNVGRIQISSEDNAVSKGIKSTFCASIIFIVINFLFQTPFIQCTEYIIDNSTKDHPAKDIDLLRRLVYKSQEHDIGRLRLNTLKQCCNTRQIRITTYTGSLINLAGSTIFSKIDLVRGHHQTSVNKDIIAKTAIVSSFCHINDFRSISYSNHTSQFLAFLSFSFLVASSSA